LQGFLTRVTIILSSGTLGLVTAALPLDMEWNGVQERIGFILTGK